MSLEGYRWVRLSEALKEIPDVAAHDRVDSKFPHSRGLWCAWHYCTSFARAIEDCIVLVHGPLGCQGNYQRFFNSIGGALRGFDHIPCTDMDNQQVILGGESNLEKAIKEVDQDYKPALLWIATTCASGLNMDDVGGIVERIQPEIKAKLFWTDNAGFCATWPGEMADKFISPMAELMEEPDQVHADAVNILGVRYLAYAPEDPSLPQRRRFKPKWGSNAAELGRIIEALGLKVHRVLLGGTFEYFKTAPQAAVNVLSCPTWGWPLVKAMEERFGTPWLRESRAIGVDPLIRWITDLAKFMKVEDQAYKFINHEYGQIRAVWDKAKEVTKGRTALICGSRSSGYQVTRPIVLARFAMELGMTPYLYNIHPLALKSEEERIKYFIETGTDPLYLFGAYSYQKPVNDYEVMKILGLSGEDVVYFHDDAFPYGDAPLWDASVVAHTDPQGRMLRRLPKGLARDVGFASAAAYAQEVVAAIKAVRKGKPMLRPTLYGRIFSKDKECLDFEFNKVENPNCP